ELGVAGVSMSPGLTAMNDQAAAAGPFAKAARLLEVLAGVRLTVKRVERAAEASGTAAAQAVRDRAGLIAGRKLVPLPPSPLPDKLYAAIDGTGVPVTAKETAGRPGKAEDGRARTREVKLAVFFTQDKLDAKGYPVRDQDSSSYVATFEPASAFAGLAEAEGIRRGARHVRQMTILGDGAAWIWGIASSKFPEATQIVDLFHAREHLHDLARLLEFMLGDRIDDWLAARLQDLDYGDIDGICAAARAYPLAGVKKDQLDTALGYFENNAPRMRYKWFRSRGLFVGSGAVEAGCKSVIGQRLKLSGMHWTVEGADAIATLRCQQASRPEDRIWPAPHNQTRTA
ncbi:MAG TPA: ISKra4 family transposase, partial [Streptosporangiaceae bacterium]|nr:ISKra4 family transposase [Streptosporangiaceae bacterium]